MGLKEGTQYNHCITIQGFIGAAAHRRALVVLLALLIASIHTASALDLTVSASGSFMDVNGPGTGNDPTCFRTATTWGGVTGTYVSYGIPSDSSCPGSLNLGTQSGFGFVPATIGTIQDGVMFKLGTFTHYNHPVSSSTAFNYITLRITLTITGATPSTTTYDYVMHLDETPNRGTCVSCAYQPCETPCPDKAWWSNLGSSSTFTIGGKTYTLELKGFAACTDPSTPIAEFVTQENKANVACIYANITECIVTITGDPVDQTVCPPNLNSASFTVAATGPALTYQWYKEAGATDIKLTDTAPYSGAKTATLTINPATSAQAGDYYVVVTGSCGAAKTSNPARLTVVNAPQITMDLSVT
ncbi:MAG TPA: THxN family PEP-CTERM protein [Methanothrix sp.]|nr:THxN family PEP-CTERM protein [Methanothrix sp.]HQE87118.1 THxN family PEP-CTERM protein [Methanothrix sp.]HQI68826.1 THxN family PEP-CTERM protein [Methanothrix sp.]